MKGSTVRATLPSNSTIGSLPVFQTNSTLPQFVPLSNAKLLSNLPAGTRLIVGNQLRPLMPSVANASQLSADAAVSKILSVPIATTEQPDTGCSSTYEDNTNAD